MWGLFLYRLLFGNYCFDLSDLFWLFALTARFACQYDFQTGDDPLTHIAVLLLHRRYLGAHHPPFHPVLPALRYDHPGIPGRFQINLNESIKPVDNGGTRIPLKTRNPLTMRVEKSHELRAHIPESVNHLLQGVLRVLAVAGRRAALLVAWRGVLGGQVLVYLQTGGMLLHFLIKIKSVDYRSLPKTDIGNLLTG